MLATRLITAVLALGLFLAALFLLPWAGWVAVLLPALLLGAREWAALAGYARGAAWAYATLTVAVAAAVAFTGRDAGPVHPVHAAVYAIGVAFWLLVAPLWLKSHWQARGHVLALVGWIVLIPTWLALVELQAAAGALLAFMGVVWTADTAAYLVGRQFGRRKLAPAISPGKTWEGVAGAVVAVGIYYAVLLTFADRLPLPVSGATGALLFGLLLALSIEGDLFESLLKRQAGVKDSGRLLPGHGGVLDRIDGLTSTLPLVALLAAYSR